MRAITDDERKAIALILEKVPQLIADEISDCHTMEGVYAPWRRLLAEMTEMSITFGAMHSIPDDAELNALYEAAWTVWKLIRGG